MYESHVVTKKMEINKVYNVRPGAAGLLTGVEYSRVGSSTWICPTSNVSTRIGVVLIGVLRN